MGFVANFIRFPAMQNFDNRLRFDKVTESSKVVTFLRHSVVLQVINKQQCCAVSIHTSIILVLFTLLIVGHLYIYASMHAVGKLALLLLLLLLLQYL